MIVLPSWAGSIERCVCIPSYPGDTPFKTPSPDSSERRDTINHKISFIDEVEATLRR